MSPPSQRAFAAVPLLQQERRDMAWSYTDWPDKRRLHGPCPFCKATVSGYSWSIAGGGKRCPCGAICYRGSAYRCPVRREVRIVETQTGKVERAFDVSAKSERHVERLEAGLGINLDHARFHVEDVSELAPLPMPKQPKRLAR